MKSILNKVYFHPVFLLTILVFILIGKFRFITYFMLIIIIHELGHIIVSMIFNWKIDKIIILPFGGLIKYNEFINRKLVEEFFVSIAGFIFQITFYVIIKDGINYKYFSLINYFILLFNFIPIYPLDGSKILNVFLNILFSFKSSLLITTIISYISLILLLLITFNINKIIIIITLFLFIETYKLNKSIDYIFNKFLLERHLHNFKFKNEIIINNIYKMKKDCKHLFLINGKYETECKYLEKKFNKKSIRN